VHLEDRKFQKSEELRLQGRFDESAEVFKTTQRASIQRLIAAGDVDDAVRTATQYVDQNAEIVLCEAVVRAQVDLGTALFAAGRFEECAARLEKALDGTLRIHGEDSDPYFSGIVRVADVYRKLRRFDAALGMVHRALQSAVQCERRRPKLVARAWSCKASVYFDQSRITDADHAMREAFRILGRGKDSPEPEELLQMAKIKTAMGQSKLAERLTEKAAAWPL